jgi:aspartate aminotransferase
MMEDLEEANEGENVLFHLCGHNPTGNDPTIE